MNRWKVKKSKWFKNSMVGAPLVYTGRWHIESDDGERLSSFPTWREALSYADRMARTVRYVLPRIAETHAIPSKYDAKDEPPLVVENKGCMTWLKQYEGEEDGLFVILDKAQLKPLALALLAHHYKQEQT